MNRFRSPAAISVLRFSFRLGLAFLSVPEPATADVCNWEGGDSVWSSDGNWSCSAVPGNSDNAVLNTDDNLDLDVAAGVQKFTLSSANALLQGAGSLTSNSAFDLQSGTVSAILAGSNGADKTTAGTVTLSGSNTYTGTTTISAGTLALGANNVFDNNSSIVVDGGTLAMGTFSDTVAGVTLQSGTISGNGGVLTSDSKFILQSGSVSAVLAGDDGADKTTAGTVTLSGANTYTGTTTISAGTLALGANNVFDNNSSLVVDGGTLAMGAFSDTVAGVTLQSGTISGNGGVLTSDSKFILQSGEVNAILAGTQGAEKTTADTVTLKGTNTYTGATTISAGTLALGANNVFDNNSSLVVDGGTLAMGTFSDTVAGVTLQSGTISGSGGVLTSNSKFVLQSGEVNAILAGTQGAEKTTADTVTLKGANTYTGATTVSAGTLALGASNVLADGSSIVVDGGTLAMGTFSDTVLGVTLQSGTISGSGVLTSNTTYNLQSGSIDAVLAGNFGINKTTADTVTLNGDNTYTGTTQVNAGTLIFNGSGNHTLTGSYTGAGTLEFADGTNQFATGATIATANLILSGGTNQITSGASVTSSNVTLSGGSNTIDKALSVTSFAVSGGSNTLNAALTATNATFDGGLTDTTDINASYNVSGTTTVNGGNVNFASSTPAVLGQTLVINGGQVSFAAAVTEVDEYIQTDGILSGPGELRVSSATLSGGSMLGPGKFIIDGNGGTSTNLLLNGNFQLDNQSTLINSGNVVVAANAALQGSGTYRQTAGTTRVDGNWSQALTEIQAGVFRGNGSIGGDFVNQGTVGANGDNLILNGPVVGSGAYAGGVQFNNSFAPGPAPSGAGIAQIDASNADLVFGSSSKLIIEFGGDQNGQLVSDSITARSIALQGASLDLRRLASQPNFTPQQFFAQTAILTTTTGNISGAFNSDVDCPTGSDDLYVLSQQEKQFLLTIVPRLPNLVPADVQSLAGALQQADCNPNTPASLQNLLNGLKPFLSAGTSETDKVNQFVNALRQISPKQLAAEQTLTNRVGKLQVANLSQRMDNQRQFSAVGSAAPQTNFSANVGSPAPSAPPTSGVSPGGAGAAPATSGERSGQAPAAAPSSGALSINLQSDPDSPPDLLSSFKNLGFFLNGQFEWVDRTSTLVQRGYRSALYGVTAGADYRFSQRFLLGTSLGYGNTYAEIANNGGDQSIGGYTASLFSSLNLTDNWYIDAVANLSYNQYHTNRTTAYTDANGNAVNETAKSKTDGWQQQFSLSSGYDLPMGEWTFGLRARGEYADMSIAGRKEHGANLGMNLVIDDQKYDSLTSAVGAVVMRSFSLPFGVLVSQINVEYERQWIDKLPSMKTGFADQPNVKFTTASYVVDQDYLNVRAAVSAQLPYGGSAFLQYDTTLGLENTSRHAINAGF